MAVLAAVAPLWAARSLPFVDLPAHLYVADVLRRLHDPATVYPHYFAIRRGLTTYVGYYDVVALLGRIMPLETANRLFLTATVAALPLSLAFLLTSLRRPAWAALLAVPFAYGDSMGWGFFNFCAAFPLAYLSLGLFARSVSEPHRRALWSAALAVSLCAMFALHPAPAAFLALALPWLLATTRAPEDGVAGMRPRIVARLAAIVALLPVVAMGLVWLHRLTGARVPGRSSALALANFQYPSLGQNLANFPQLLANLMQDGSDRWGLYAAATVALAATGAWALGYRATVPGGETWIERLRPAGLVALAVIFYLCLPLNIQGSIWYLNPRFSLIAAALATGLVPRLEAGAARRFAWMAAAAALVTAAPLVRGFRAFDREAHSLQVLAGRMDSRPAVLGLMFDNHSRIVQHPVYLHAAEQLARERGGIPGYTFANLDIVPIRYRTAPPPDVPDEWVPATFDDDLQGRFYDFILVRGAPPERVFGDRLGREVDVAASSGDFWLIRRRKAPPAPMP